MSCLLFTVSRSFKISAFLRSDAVPDYFYVYHHFQNMLYKHWTAKQGKKLNCHFFPHKPHEQFSLHVITALKLLINSSRMTAKNPRLEIYCFQEKLHCTIKYGINLSYLVLSSYARFGSCINSVWHKY